MLPKIIDKQAVLERVAADFNISVDKIIGKSRLFELVDARCVVASVFNYFGWPATRIAALLGGRDHTTVRNLLKRIKGREELKRMADGYVEIFKK